MGLSKFPDKIENGSKKKKTDKILSARSNNPPWPGKNPPESFKLPFLFRNERSKSPDIEESTIRKPTIMKVKKL